MTGSVSTMRVRPKNLQEAGKDVLVLSLPARSECSV